MVNTSEVEEEVTTDTNLIEEELTNE
jgi:hypothetical protein